MRMTSELFHDRDNVTVTFEAGDVKTSTDMTKKEYIRFVKGDNIIVRTFKRIFK